MSFLGIKDMVKLRMIDRGHKEIIEYKMIEKLVRILKY